MTPERLAEIREQVADYHCQECALDVELLAYVDGLRRERATLRADVERLRDEAWDAVDSADDGSSSDQRALGRARMAQTVLDLIDKREGQ